jgi:hypothetical protein
MPVTSTYPTTMPKRHPAPAWLVRAAAARGIDPAGLSCRELSEAYAATLAGTIDLSALAERPTRRKRDA